MKRLLIIALALTLVLNFSACGTSSDTPPQNDNKESLYTEQSTLASEIETKYTTSEAVTETHKKTLGEFFETAEIEETVMIDENDVKITAKGLKYTSYSVELELDIENNSDKALSFISGSLGYSCNSVNGYMISDGYLNCDIAAGKKANDSISFSYDGLMLYGITYISDIGIGFYTSDDDYNYTYYTPRQIKTSAFERHDYSKNCYQERYIASQKKNVILVLADMSAPPLPFICPPSDLEAELSMGNILGAAHVTETLVKQNAILHRKNEYLTMFGMLKGENAFTYPPYTETQAKELLSELRKMADYIVIDCTSNITGDVLSAVSLIESDAVLRLVSCDLKSISYLSSQLPLLLDNKFNANKQYKINKITELLRAKTEQREVTYCSYLILPPRT